MQKLQGIGTILILLVTMGGKVIESDEIGPSIGPRLPLAAPRGNEPQARAAVAEWLERKRHLQRDALDPEMLEKAYYLAGEASSMWWNPRHVELFPAWPGYRYVVGRADGAWTRYWSGCRRGNQNYGKDGTVWAGWGAEDVAALVEHPYPGLHATERAGVAVAWRRGRAYVAVIWKHLDPCPEIMIDDWQPNEISPEGPSEWGEGF
jgi:hypothetical protein